MKTPILLAVILSIGLGTEASSNSLSAPDTVYADSEGNFSYRFAFTVNPDSTRVAGYGWNDGDNVSGAVHADCLCFPNCDFAPDEQLHFDVTGALVNPVLPGSVENWVALCLEPDSRAITVVMPKTPLPALPVTWGRIKAWYR